MKAILAAIATINAMTDEQADALGQQLYNEKGVIAASDMLSEASMKIHRVRDAALDLHNELN